MNDSIVLKLLADFPGHSVGVKKGTFGIQLVVDGTVVANSWDLKDALTSDSDLAKAVSGLSSEDTMYTYFKKKTTAYIKAKGAK